MKRMKTFFKYAIWLILFFIFSEILINIGLNTSYKKMDLSASDTSQVEIEQAESTRVNGRIKGKIKDSSELEGKFVKFDFYNKRDNIVGTEYIEVQPSSTSQDFSFFFQGEGVEYFKTSIVDKIDGSLTKLKLFDHDLSRAEILTILIFTYGIFF